MKRVIDDGETIRRRPHDPAAQAEFPLMAELAAGGITDYLALPLGGTATLHNAMTMGTTAAGGFTDDQVAGLLHLYRLFALHVEGHIMRRIAENISAAYLGAEAGRKVLDGAIRRGAGESLRAIIWVSDLRGFTALSDRLAGPDMLAVLNAYFERMAGAVLAGGGDVLKFMGDGMLAVFPFSDDGGGQAAARRALTAAEAALAALAAMNRDPPPEIAGLEGWKPLGTGIALHEGEVFFGNIGAPERLDFTVIGPAVNEAARVEALTKALGQPILLTAPVVRRLSRPLRSLGSHALRGVGGAMELFAPA
jgi:adenylate cyclase